MAYYTHLQFTVPGTPVAKGRPKFRRVGSYVQTYTPSETIKAEVVVGEAFLGAYPGFSVCVGDAKTVLPDSTIAHYVDVWNATKNAVSRKQKNNTRKYVLGREDSGRLPGRESECSGRGSERDSYRPEELKAKGAANGIALTCKFYCPIPASFSKRKRERLRGQLCLKKPDIDNYVKLVCDALNGIAWEDDNVIANMVAVKMYDEQPRTEVHIYYLEEGLDKCENMCYTNSVQESR